MRWVRILAVALAVGGALASSPASATQEVTLAVTPSATAAGTSVTVSGNCRPNDAAQLDADGVVGPGERFFGGRVLPTGPDGSFSVPFPIPEESPTSTWTFSLLCF